MFSPRCQFLIRNVISLSNTLNTTVGISTTSRVQWANTTTTSVSHYESLGVPKSSTQNDIKTAYYKLSKQYHPDKNQGCETAAKKFREITRAYEVLGNYKLRRLYDRGIIHTAGPQYAKPDIREEVEDDPETKFYKSRFTRTEVKDSSGRTPIYDFDEWSRAHYGEAFEKRKRAKARWDFKQSEKKRHVLSFQTEVVFLGLIVCLIIPYAIFKEMSSFDTPIDKVNKRSDEG